jgi:F420-non-reducing hydrogenase small subunit
VKKMDKLKFAFYWGASCGGCEIAVLDINERVLEVLQIGDIVFWPVAMDTKYKDVEAMPDKSIDVSFFNGSVRNDEGEHMAKLLRQKSKFMIAFGSCAHEGCIPGLSNLHNRETIFEKVYKESVSTVNPNGVVPQTSYHVPEGEIHIPAFHDTVKTLDQVVDVDYYIPGCPPNPDIIVAAIDALATAVDKKYAGIMTVNGYKLERLPPKGAVLAPNRAQCFECPLKKEDKRIDKIYRVHEKIPEPGKCLLDQGIICMGPATRMGCHSQCMKAGMPCTGCQGPVDQDEELGASMMSALTSNIGLDDEKASDYEPNKLIEQIKDPIGTFYMYSLPASILKRKVMKK